ncbi:MAG: hypothetical protein QOK07_881 [Gemmatimonadaceae bacterium]|jgi:hypothetical protein|nr:hypothetical protein [Gemmatimonadaceae bacterium]
MSVKHLYVMAVAAVMGCAAAGSGPRTIDTGVPRKSNVLTLEEVSAAHADVATAYDAVARLRPNWLASHGVTTTVANGGGTEYATVYVDGQPFGDLTTLRNIPAYHVSEYRYYNITEAGAKFGLRGGNSGVIDVITNLQSRS